MLLTIDNLSISYDSNVNPTVKNINFNLDNGEILAIVGESGSGKTTVIRSILGVLPPTGKVISGKIVFEEQNILNYTAKNWRNIRGKNISMIFQDCGNMLNPIQNIGKQFIEYIKTHTKKTTVEATELAIEMLKRMNLPNPERIMKAYPFELSGGMRQRVGIAMAITFSPKLLLADEPTSALDVTTQAQIVKELLSIRQKDNMSMIIVTHNIGVAAYISDKIIVMKNGEIIDYGKTKDILQKSTNPYTKDLLAAVPQIGGKRYV